jgi:hypothetical protein
MKPYDLSPPPPNTHSNFVSAYGTDISRERAAELYALENKDKSGNPVYPHWYQASEHNGVGHKTRAEENADYWATQTSKDATALGIDTPDALTLARQETLVGKVEQERENHLMSALDIGDSAEPFDPRYPQEVANAARMSYVEQTIANSQVQAKLNGEVVKKSMTPSQKEAYASNALKAWGQLPNGTPYDLTTGEVVDPNNDFSPTGWIYDDSTGKVTRG